MKTINTTFIFAIMAFLMGCGMNSKVQTESSNKQTAPKLSAKAQSFLDEAQKDLSGFNFTVSFQPDDAVAVYEGILLTTAQALAKEQDAYVIEEAQAMEIIRYFARGGGPEK